MRRGFNVNERDEVEYVTGVSRIVLGPKDQVCEDMRLFVTRNVDDGRIPEVKGDTLHRDD